MTYSESRAEKANTTHAAIRRQAEENRKGIERLQYAKKVRAWLQQNPQVGTLNSGKFYVLTNNFHSTGEIQEIPAFSAL
jgi:hypothetical protein